MIDIALFVRYIKAAVDDEISPTFMGRAPDRIMFDLAPPHPEYGYRYKVSITFRLKNWGLGNRLKSVVKTGTNSRPEEILERLSLVLVDDDGQEWLYQKIGENR